MESSNRGNSRRDFIKTVAVAAGAAGALGACGKAAMSPSDGGGGLLTRESKGVPIVVAGYRYDRVDALIDTSSSTARPTSVTLAATRPPTVAL